jgi:hypothetical protein
MATVIIFHETEDGDHWAKAWHHGEGGRHEMFAKIGVKARTFRDPNNPDSTGVIAEIPDMEAFEELLASEEGQKAMAEDGLKVETLRMLTEFTT